MNVHGSWANHALALGLPKAMGVKEQVNEFSRRWDTFPVAPEWRDDPPWAENVMDGDDVNIFEVLPLVRLNDGDGGFYIDKAAVVSKDPEDPGNSGKQNVGIYRIQVKGKRKLALQPVPMHDIALQLRKAEEVGEDCPSPSPSAMTRSSPSPRPPRCATTRTSTNSPAHCAARPHRSPRPR